MTNGCVDASRSFACPTPAGNALHLKAASMQLQTPSMQLHHSTVAPFFPAADEFFISDEAGELHVCNFLPQRW
jgi:hypothetical protein